MAPTMINAKKVVSAARGGFNPTGCKECSSLSMVFTQIFSSWVRVSTTLQQFTLEAFCSEDLAYLFSLSFRDELVMGRSQRRMRLKRRRRSLRTHRCLRVWHRGWSLLSAAGTGASSLRRGDVRARDPYGHMPWQPSAVGIRVPHSVEEQVHRDSWLTAVGGMLLLSREEMAGSQPFLWPSI